MYGIVSTPAGFSQLIENSNLRLLFYIPAPDDVSMGSSRSRLSTPSHRTALSTIIWICRRPVSSPIRTTWNTGISAGMQITTAPQPLSTFKHRCFCCDGALVHAGWFYYYDNNADVNVKLTCTAPTWPGSWIPSDAMADFESFETNQYSVSAVPLTKYTRIDNSKYAYWIYYELPASAELPPVMGGRGHVIRLRMSRCTHCGRFRSRLPHFHPKLTDRSTPTMGATWRATASITYT